MTTLKRITPEQVVEAYRRTGWRPIQEAFYDRINGQHCGCGLSVLVGDAEKVLQMECYTGLRLQLFANELGLTADYVSGFIRGYDGDGGSSWWDSEKLLGWQDGRACWEAVKREVLEDADVE